MAAAQHSKHGGELILYGVQNAGYLAVASFALLVYEYFITLDDEIRYFWSGSWTISRVLYLINRYLPPLVMVMTLTDFFGADLSSSVCQRSLRATVTLSLIAVLVIQAILVVRVYYLFSHSISVRIFAIATYLATSATSIVILTLVLTGITLRPQFSHVHMGCLVSKSRPLWPFFIPSLVLHTILYILTSLRAMTSKSSTPVLKRLRRDGGIFYVVVLLSVGLSGIGAFLVQFPAVNIPAIYSNFMLVITSVSMSRVMLSIHSLAANLGTDPEWLLNNVELSRVRWRKGAHDGELIVVVDMVDGDSWESGPDSDNRRSGQSVSSSQLGVIDDFYGNSSPYPY